MDTYKDASGYFLLEKCQKLHNLEGGIKRNRCVHTDTNTHFLKALFQESMKNPRHWIETLVV